VDEANAASVALIDGKKVLLIRRAFDPLRGRWTLPGGRREPGEAIEATAIRELREELRLSISGLHPVMQLRPNASFLLQVFATTEFSGDIVASPEIAGRQWVEAGRLGNLPTTPDLEIVLHRAFALFQRR
jgi:8-oxo-dGTP pyrophosphatase MutT (NUDIX family)